MSPPAPQTSTRPLPPARRRRVALEEPRQDGKVALSPHEIARRCRLVARLVAGHYEVSVTDITGRRRMTRRATRARHVAIYLAHVAAGASLLAAGAAFARDRTTAAYACRTIEDARDSAAFDAMLTVLERALHVLLDLDRERVAA